MSGETKAWRNGFMRVNLVPFAHLHAGPWSPKSMLPRGVRMPFAFSLLLCPQSGRAESVEGDQFFVLA